MQAYKTEFEAETSAVAPSIALCSPRLHDHKRSSLFSRYSPASQQLSGHVKQLIRLLNLKKGIDVRIGTIKRGAAQERSTQLLISLIQSTFRPRLFLLIMTQSVLPARPKAMPEPSIPICSSFSMFHSPCARLPSKAYTCLKTRQLLFRTDKVTHNHPPTSVSCHRPQHLRETQPIKPEE
ncbi:hypothetical protein N657DRAFT_359824 [Parathielavia appendiculata]|uniref:Uncharacterized protein n=1 Tax=Parathielavia appendiculata TaxID=2587402 RepID=A0AAN6U2F0_9PEZI|nr:hypothetical protein N657DRAFT_359824 [Parathielavia appendiculata]